MTDYLPPCGWVPSPNYNSRGGCKIDQVVIHDMEGFMKPSEVLFEEKSSHVSAHYAVSADGTKVDLLVPEQYRAWHACDFNSRSIGIEQEGFSKAGFSVAEMTITARLTAYLCKKYGIPLLYANGGAGSGITSHWSLGREGGGHSDPEPNDQWIQDFVKMVQQETYAGRYPTIYGPGVNHADFASAYTAYTAAKHDLTTTFGVQEALKALTFDIQVDGQLGSQTETVIENFQVIAGLPPTGGQIDDQTRAAIQKALEG